MREIKREKGFLHRLFHDAASREDAETVTQKEPEIPVEEAEAFDESFEAAREDAMREAEKSSSNVMPAEGNYLEALRRETAVEELEGEQDLYFSNFTLEGREPSDEEKDFLMGLQATAKACMEDREVVLRGEKKGKPVNAQICIKVSGDEMAAWIFAFPPVSGGKEFSEDLVVEALSQCGVNRGIDEVLIGRIVRGRKYLKLATAARGAAPAEGREGAVRDLFPRIERPENREEASAEESPDWLHQVEAGEVICEIDLPVESAAGYRVSGEVLKGRKIPRLEIPSGSNTRITADGTKLVSVIDGTLYYEAGKFHVKDVLNILSDVDAAVGDIDTIGNLSVKGDVASGFTVKATGNIEILGMVGNSVVEAGGDIEIGMGVRGCGGALLKAGGEIRCGYIENCTVRCRGTVYSRSVINCDVTTDKSVEGDCIVGGSISALYQIHAKTIGNSQRRQTTLSLGNTQEVRQKKIRLEARVKELNPVLRKMIKDIRFLQSKKELVPKEEKLYREMTAEYEKLENEMAEAKTRLRELAEGISDFSQCELKAETIYPPATVIIMNDAQVIERRMDMCRIWSEDGEIRMS